LLFILCSSTLIILAGPLGFLLLIAIVYNFSY
jgi:hypothetical protein